MYGQRVAYHERAVAFTFSVSDVVPYVCGVYRCRCGKTSVRHGRLAATPPPGWEERAAPGGEPIQACDECAPNWTPPPPVRADLEERA
jgi:hypothetical protein